MWIRLSALFWCLLLIAACGGTEGNTPDPPPDPPVFLCPDGATEAADLSECPEPEPTGTCDWRDWESIPDRDIELFFKDFRYGNTVRWAQSPELRMADNLTPRQRGVVAEAVSRVNEILPGEAAIEIGDDVEPGTDDVPDGNIYVEFAPVSEWTNANGKPLQKHPDTYGHASWVTQGRAKFLRARIWVGPATDNKVCYGLHADDFMLKLVTHELLHAIGFTGHSRTALAPDTVVGWEPVL